MISLIPLPPHNVAAIWQRLLPGIEKALLESHNEVTAEGTYNALMNGHWLLWLGLVDGELMGVTITELLTSARGTWLNVLFTYSDAPIATHLMQHGIKILESHARSLGLRGVKMLSSRKGFGRVARSLGMKQRFVEYINDFSGEPSDG